MSELARKLIEENLKTKNPYLDLGNCGLDGTEEILELLAECEHLETLIFSNDWWNGKKEYREDSQNSGKQNKLYRTPIHLPKNLHNLIIAGGQTNQWSINNINPIKKLYHLKNLNIANNLIDDITPIQELKQIHTLYLHSNKVQDITPIKKLINLKYLNFSKNEVQDITPIKELINLSLLSFYLNKVQDITPIKELVNLKYLVFSSNQVRDISSVKELRSLERLYLEQNQVEDITPISELKNLQRLYFASNKVHNIISLKALKKITSLSFKNNPFIKILPPEIQEKDGLEILQYWIDTYTQTDTAQPIREAKVVFVGEGGSGKTSLMQRILYEKKEQTTRTEKIEIHTDTTQFTYGKEEDPLTLRFWDFGGQDIMHATHKFFMSSRTLYVLVTHGRKNEDEVLENWVEMLKSSVGGSPVILVANHLDNEEDTHRIPDEELRRKLPNLTLPVIETSWETGRGLETLKQAIQDALQKMPHFKEDFSPLYLSAKQKLNTINKPYIPYEVYKEICQEVAQEKAAEFKVQSQSILADFLNDLGIMLNFRKANDKLEDLFIFQPSWIVDGVYKIINAGETQQQKGKVQEETVTELLKAIDYKTAQERNFIIEMMKHFKLAFEHRVLNQCHYLIPSLFDKNRPASIAQNWQPSHPLRVRFQYDIWRNDYISYFLVSQHQYIETNQYWINGAILNYGEQRIFIEADRSKKSMRIEVAAEKDKRYAFWRVREALTQVHEMFDVEKLGISMWVVYEEDGQTDEFSYNRLRKMLDNGRKHEYSEVFNKDIDIAKLLGEVSLTKSEIPLVIVVAIKSLENASYAGYFEEMDKLDLPHYLRHDYSKLKRDFISKDFDTYTAERLETFAKKIIKELA